MSTPGIGDDVTRQFTTSAEPALMALLTIQMLRAMMPISDEAKYRPTCCLNSRRAWGGGSKLYYTCNGAPRDLD
jgi:hypothetical protein